MTTPREIGESYWRAEERRDIDAILSHFHADAVFHPVAGPLYGHDQIRTFYEGMGDEFPGLEVTVSAKVGRLRRADAPRDESQFYRGEPFYKDVPAVGPVWDFSYDGIMKSVDDSFQRTGLDRFDALLLHDPDDHFDEASTSGFKALAHLRPTGTAR